jgi:hypothetical protein
MHISSYDNQKVVPAKLKDIFGFSGALYNQPVSSHTN